MNATDLARLQVATPPPDQRRFALPHGHEASVILAPGLFRFEVWSTDPADANRGQVVTGLTSEQAQEKVAAVAALPAKD